MHLILSEKKLRRNKKKKVANQFWNSLVHRYFFRKTARCLHCLLSAAKTFMAKLQIMSWKTNCQLVFLEVGLFFVLCKLFNIRFSIVIWSSQIPFGNLWLPGYSDVIRTKATQLAPLMRCFRTKSSSFMKAFMPRLERGKILKQHLNLSKLFGGGKPYFMLLKICMVTLGVFVKCVHRLF